VLLAIRHIVLAVIDFFHTPFARWIDKRTFRYLASGGSGAVLNISISSLAFHFLFHERDIVTGWPLLPVITALTAAAAVAFCISTPYGFLMSRYIVFQESNLKGRVQMFRYLLTVGACILLTYFFVRFFHFTCGIFPTPSFILTNIVVAMFSYMAQRFFTFKVKAEPPVAG
jgi:putative flippase GtrA